MKNLGIVFLLFFCCFVWICGGTVTATEIKNDFSFFKEECPINFEGLKLVDAVAREENNAAGLNCTYEGITSLEDIESKVKIKYDLKHRVSVTASTFALPSEMQPFFEQAIAEMNGKEYESIVKESEKKYIAESFVRGNGSEAISVRERADFVLSDRSFYMGAHTMTLMPMRTIKLDSSLSEKNIENAVDRFRDRLFQKKGVEGKALEVIAEKVALKEKELELRPEINSFFEEWNKVNKENHSKILERKNWFSWAGCLVFDGLGLSFSQLEKWGLENPSQSCAFFLYEDVAKANELRITRPALSAYVNSYQEKTSYCVNEKVKGIFRGEVLDWTKKTFEYKVEDLLICEKNCLYNEEGKAFCN